MKREVYTALEMITWERNDILRLGIVLPVPELRQNPVLRVAVFHASRLICLSLLLKLLCFYVWVAFDILLGECKYLDAPLDAYVTLRSLKH
jgi:hypothetical protein